MIQIKKGLDIPVSGRPVQEISHGPEVHRVAIVADDYVGLRPAMAVSEGEQVRLGQAIFADKTHPDILLTAPASGIVSYIHRGPKRKLISVEIQVKGQDEERFPTRDVGTLTGDLVREGLTRSGLWAALRTRPFNKIPDPQSAPRSIFVTAMDTQPLAGDPAVILGELAEDFVLGLHALTRLTEGPVYVCHEEGRDVPGRDVSGVTMASFAGPHPAGLPGTHIHFLDPVGVGRTVWFIGYQDVATYGTFFRTGRIATDRVVALAGPSVREPRLLRTRTGACLDELIAGQLVDEESRIVSGSLLSGRQSVPPANFLGRYHVQVSVLPEGRQREFFGWAGPAFDKFSITRTCASFWFRRSARRLPGIRRLTVAGEPWCRSGCTKRSCRWIFCRRSLLRALIVGDTDQAQALGCLELDEDDLGLCTFVCPSKYDYGPILRDNLTTIEREG